MLRIGIGYDIHRLEPERPLVLGGVDIPHNKGPLGHSDGDALCHAIIDALLGAAALGNIGQFFPDTDPAYRNADSVELLSKTVQNVAEAGYSIVNIDSNIVAQQPPLNPFISAMRDTLAKAMGIPTESISIKPKTKELVGPEGREQAISAQAVVLLEKT